MPRPQTRWGGCLGRFHDGSVEGCEAIPRDRDLEGLHHQAEPNESVVAMAAGDERVPPGTGGAPMGGLGGGARPGELD